METIYLQETFKAYSEVNSSRKMFKVTRSVHEQLMERGWLLKRVEKDLIFLIHQSRAYGIAVGINDIDWNAL